MSRKTLRHLVLILTCAGAGALSAILAFEGFAFMATRSALLAACLGSGIVIINTRNRERLDEGRAPTLSTVLGAGLATGVVGGLVVNWYGTGGMPVGGDFPPQPTAAGLATVCVAAGYGLLFHAAYAQRWRGRCPFIRSAALVTLAGVLVTFIRSPFLSRHARSLVDLLGEGTVFSLFSGVPFALLWLTVVAAADPAYSATRWTGETAMHSSVADR